MDDRLNIILSPHFDDAVFSLGGFIATAPERTIVVTVFAGTPADGTVGRWDRRSGFKTAAEATHARSLENEAALAVLGMPPNGILNLDHLDRQYRPDRGPVAGLQSSIAETLGQIARRHGGKVNVFAPASGWHPDHRLVTDAVIELWKTGELPGADVFLYQDQPYAYLELRRRTWMPLKFANFGTGENRRSVSARPQWLEFDEALAARKQQAARRYKSQFPVVGALLIKMIDDFSRYQARSAGLSTRHAELAYRLTAPDVSPHS
jgi:LmbE family N-acetylglucosaminyl deacetylase